MERLQTLRRHSNRIARLIHNLERMAEDGGLSNKEMGLLLKSRRAKGVLDGRIDRLSKPYRVWLKDLLDPVYGTPMYDEVAA